VPELSLNDRLQPALLDRLLDDERSVALVRITLGQGQLERLKLSLAGFLEILGAQGLTLERRDATADLIDLHFTAAYARTNPTQLRTLLIRPEGVPGGVTLQSFATLEFASAPNKRLEPAERRTLSRARLRECVLRDLTWLLNSLSLEASLDLEPFPCVSRSVLNFGMPSFAGRTLSSIDPLQAAEQLRRVVELFEPRLRAVRVRPTQPVHTAQRDTGAVLEFMIDAELWGQPVAQHMEITTRIDTTNGEVSLTQAHGA
jgi:type VI secretion system lysozyme-like protein